MLVQVLLLIAPAAVAAQDAHQAPAPYRRVPLRATYRVERLAQRLTRNCETDSHKVAAIHHWITHHIKYDVKKYLAGDLSEETSKRALRKRKATCVGYSTLFLDLCTASDLPCAKISGIAKSMDFDVGRRVALTDHMWNAVEINNAWYLMDITWASGHVVYGRRTLWGVLSHVFTLGRYPTFRISPRFQRNPNYRYYLKSGEAFIYNHLPAHPMWQLQVQPKTYDAFITDSAFYFLKRPKQMEQKGFECPGCKAIAQMDTLSYMMAHAELEHDFDPENPLLLANKKTHIAEQNFHPRDPLEQKKRNRSEFELADSLNEAVLQKWKHHRADAMEFNKRKLNDHKSYHKVIWTQQRSSIRELDRVRSGYAREAKVARRGVGRSKSKNKSWSRSIMKVQPANRPDTSWTTAALRQKFVELDMQWNSIAKEVKIQNEFLIAALDSQLLALPDVQELTSRLINQHKRMMVLRSMGWDDLDWPIDQLDSTNRSLTAQRLQLIKALKTGVSTKEVRQKMARINTLHRQLDGIARQHRTLLKKWLSQTPSGTDQRALRDSILNQYANTSALLIEQSKLLERALLDLKRAYPSLKWGIYKERRVHRRDHYLALEAGNSSRRWIVKRYYSVYHVIKPLDRLSSRRVNRLRNDIDRLEKMK